MRKSLVLSMTCVALIPLVGLAQTDGYDSRSYARLSYVSGAVHVQRPGDLGYEAGTVNLALAEGDKLGTQDGRAEVSFGSLNCLRIDRLSQVEFVNLPRDAVEPYKLHLLSGSLYLRISRMESDKEFEVHTPDASFYALAEGLYRLDVLQDKETRFSAVEGEAEVAGEEGSFTLRSGQSLVASNGKVQTGLAGLYAENDEFGRWNQSRDSLLARNTSGSSYLPQELDEYGYELEGNGDWRYEADYGYVWVPRVHHYDDWRPYYYGRWVWYPIIGWTWVPDEPWGWSVYHYGRWHWGLGLGWYWIPTRHWGPAWVHWYSDYGHVGWCALNWWNRPTVIINNHFYNDYSANDYSVHNRAMVVVNRNQLQAPRISSVALRGDALNRIGRVTLAARQPGLLPARGMSGRLQGEASRTFALTGGRNVARSFDRQGAVRGSTLRTRSELGVLNERQASGPRAVDGRAIRGGRTGADRGMVREYGLTGRRAGPSVDNPPRLQTGRSSRSSLSSPAPPGSASRRIRTYDTNRARTFSSNRSVPRLSGRSSSSDNTVPRSSSRLTNSRRTASSRTSPDLSFSSGRSTTSGSRSPLPRTYSSRSASSSRSNRSTSLSNREGSSGSSRRTAYRSYSSAPRTSSAPSYSRPSFSTSNPRGSSSSRRTYSAPSRNSSRSVSLSSSRSSRSSSSPSFSSSRRSGSSRSFSSSRSSGGSSRSSSSFSRSSGSSSRSSSSSSRRSSSSSSRSGRSSRRR